MVPFCAQAHELQPIWQSNFLMRHNHLVFSFSLLLLSAIGYGQQVPGDSAQADSTDSVQTQVVEVAPTSSIDSAKLLKIQERAGKISGQLARNRDKLAHLEKEYQQKTSDKQKAAQQAEASAQQNREAAIELSNDAANRSKAKRAQKSASRARRDTQSALRADKNLERLEKDISKVKKQIEDDEKALTELEQQK